MPDGQQQQPGQPGTQQQMTPGTGIPGVTAGQGLPPTGLQQQMQSLNQFYSQIQQAPDVGFDPRQQQAMALRGGQVTGPGDPGMRVGETNLEQMARNLAERYGLPVGAGRIVDERGNLLMTPEQIAAASGGQVTSGEAAAQLNYISQALTEEKVRQQQQKGIAAIQAGMGQVQERGRGSLAAMMSGMYESMARVYTDPNLLPEAQDFSYYIQKEQMDFAREMMRKQEEMQKKQARFGTIASFGMGLAGLATGNIPMAIGGFGAGVGGLGGTGWF